MSCPHCSSTSTSRSDGCPNGVPEAGQCVKKVAGFLPAAYSLVRRSDGIGTFELDMIIGLDEPPCGVSCANPSREIRIIFSSILTRISRQ